MAEIYIYTWTTDIDIYKPKFFATAAAAYDYLTDEFIRHLTSNKMYDDVIEKYGTPDKWDAILDSGDTIGAPDDSYFMVGDSFCLNFEENSFIMGEVYVLTDEETEKLETLIKVAKKMEANGNG